MDPSLLHGYLILLGLLMVMAEFQKANQTHRHISNLCDAFANIPLAKAHHKPSPKSRGRKVHFTTLILLLPYKRDCMTKGVNTGRGKIICDNNAIYHRFSPWPLWGKQECYLGLGL